MRYGTFFEDRGRPPRILEQIEGARFGRVQVARAEDAVGRS